MKFFVKFNGFLDDESINSICEKLSTINKEDDYNLIIEYRNSMEAQIVSDDYMLEIKPEHLKFVKDIRHKCSDLDINIKKIYLLGSTESAINDNLKINIESTQKTEITKNIIWPSKELYLFDGGKKILDNLLENQEINTDEYEAKLKLLQLEFGLIDFLEDEYYIN